MNDSSMDAVNFQSLNMVREELVATIEDSARNLEMFVTSNDDGESLQKCINGVSQIAGILSLIEFDGAKLLAEELLANANEISPGNSGRLFEKRLEVVSSSFFVLTRYLEYVQQSENKTPVLLIPQINELRKLRGEATLPESHFFSFNASSGIALPSVEPLDLNGQAQAMVVRRLRHMFQVGLLGLIRETQVENSISIMRRAVQRLHRLTSNEHPLATLWWLSNVCLSVMTSKKMTILESRKSLFGRIDRIIRQVEKSGEAALASDPPRGLVKELVYLITLSGEDSPEIRTIAQAYRVGMFPYNDGDLEKERGVMHGPSAHTVSSLAKVLQVELSNTKKILENASQASIQKIDDVDAFIATLQKIAEILAIVGLGAPSNILKEEIKRIDGWRQGDAEIDIDEMQEVANTLLYLESTVGGIADSKLSPEKIEEAGKVAQREIIASGALAEAKRIVISEALAGLSLTKRALNSFSESNFDTGHIRNIVKTLDSIRGGMIMLNNERAVLILSRCAEFVEEILLGQDAQPAMKELLETFADAVISIEYYLNSATSSLQMDESVLRIAEESLEALGFSVDEEEG